ncbi:hypothetical protein [Microbacterium sp. No. 7]|uniref:hypothetical protein n=1 Tax=Microbacterium sp. No. 7 TaxID=1714373 RepID=UPI0006ED2B5E|nr:hypothetical protein [Microbacterium sp. No. 7]ALJ19562.1 hypothetical protein AOA12_06415 [Microbacterium sp. No. 7]
MSRHELNSADYERIEAALHHLIPSTIRAAREWYPTAISAYSRTMDKIQRINKTGPYTP